MYLTNWLRNLNQNFFGRRNQKLRRRQAGAFSTIAAVVETLESRQLLSGAGPAVFAQTPYAAASPVLHSQAASAGGTVTPTATTSDNWSGYVATNNAANSVTQVSGSWTVPTVARSTGNSYSCAWVGIDGWLGNTVEQIGTEQDMVNGAPVYYAWYEMWSNGAKQLQQIFANVSPGDSVSANVQYLTTGAHAGQFQLSFADLSHPASNFSTYQTSSATQIPVAPRSQAEWIVEATQENGSVAPLANFGTVTFTNARATINGTSEPINGPYSISPPVNVYQINMVQNGVAVDSTSSLASGQTGSSFSVTFKPQTIALAPPQVSAKALSSSSVSLAWNVVPGAQGYRVYRWNASQAVLVQTLGSTTTSTQITGLSAGTTYSFLVEAFNGGTVADSAWASVTTQQKQSKVFVNDYTNTAGNPVHAVLTGTTNLVFIDRTGHMALGTWLNSTQASSGDYPGDIATFSGNKVTWSDGTVWTQVSGTSSPITLTGYTNSIGIPVYTVQNGTNTLVFIDGLGHTSLGNWVNSTQAVCYSYPGDKATFSGNTVTWDDGMVWTQTTNL